MPALNPISGDYTNLTAPIVRTWEGLLARAQEAKATFNSRGAQIMSFYSGGPTAMWEPGYMNMFMGGPQAVTPPKFKITLNIAFEQVAIMGPLLFWEMAARKVKPYKSLHIDPMALAGENQEAIQLFEQLAQQQAGIDARNEVRAQLQEHVLNYFQREQPNGLSAHSELAVFELLTKGAGFLRTEEYRYPFSDKTLVGSFFQSCDDVLVDADCTDPLWQTANYVAIRHRTKAEELEDHFSLPRGSMAQYCSISSPGAAFQAGVERDENISVPKDLVEWWEIFSRAGFGNRLIGKRDTMPIAQEFDDNRTSVMVNGKPVKDTFVYLAICPQCKYPLNLPSRELIKDHADPAWVQAQTSWPTEYWRDNKWPVELLTVYPHSGKSPWPEAPLAPALGELTCLNILMSAYIQKSWDSRQTTIAYKKGAIADLQNLLNADKNTLAIEVDPQFNEKIEEILQFIDRPGASPDLREGIEFVMGLVEKRTGLSPVLYGQTEGAEPRSATAYQGRSDTVNIRPEFMRKKIAAWQSRIADKEIWCAYTHVSSESIADQLGPLGAVAWDMLVTNENPEAILRGSKAYVEASDIRRPNKAKDTADLEAMQQYYLPILASHMAQTGDVGPINGYVESYGEAAEIDVSKILLPPQEPDATAQQMQQAELMKVQAEAENLQAEAQKYLADAEATANEGETAMQDAQIKAQTAEHGMQIKQQEAEIKAATAEQQMAMKAADHEMTAEQRMAEARQKLGIQLMESQQKMQQNAVTHSQDTAIADDRAQSDAQRSAMIGFQKMLFNRAEHAQRMQQQPSGGKT